MANNAELDPSEALLAAFGASQEAVSGAFASATGSRGNDEISAILRDPKMRVGAAAALTAAAITTLSVEVTIGGRPTPGGPGLGGGDVAIVAPANDVVAGEPDRKPKGENRPESPPAEPPAPTQPPAPTETPAHTPTPQPTPSPTQSPTREAAPPPPGPTPDPTTPPPPAPSPTTHTPKPTPITTTPPPPPPTTSPQPKPTEAAPLPPSPENVDPSLEALIKQLLNTEVSLDQIDTGPIPGFEYVPARERANGPQEGAKQLRDFVHAVFQSSPRFDVYNIYNPTATINGSGISLHAEGRAVDAGFNSNNDAERARGDKLFAWLIKNARALGIQFATWNDQAWSVNNGLHTQIGHRDHVHFELSWDAAYAKLPAYASGAVEAAMHQHMKADEASPASHSRGLRSASYLSTIGNEEWRRVQDEKYARRETTCCSI